MIFWFLNLFLQFLGNKTRLIHDRWWLFKKLRLAFHVCGTLSSLWSAVCSSSNVVSTLQSEFATICVIRCYRMNLGRGVPAGAPREPRVDRYNLQLPDLWSSLLASHRHWMDHDGSRIGREFDQSPVYIRAYIGWWLSDFSLIQFCNRNFSCGVRMQGLSSWERCTFTTEKAWRFGLLCNLSVQRLKSLWLFWRMKCYIKFWLLRF